MKRIIPCLIVIYSILVLSGCAPLMVASGALTAKQAYDGYETLTSIKNVKEESPALGGYQNVFVSFNVQPRKGGGQEVSRMLEEIYVRNLKEIAAKKGWKVNCQAYDLKTVGAGKDALIIQVREEKPTYWKRLVSGDKVHTSIDYIDRKSSMVIIGQAEVSKNYEELMRRLIMAAMVKLNPPASSGGTTTWSAAVAYFRDQDHPLILTDRERSILLKG